MTKRNLKKIPNAVSRKKRKEYREYSKFDIKFYSITILLLIFYLIFLHPPIFEFFNKGVNVIIIEFWVLTIPIFILYRHYNSRNIENKFSLLYKDLNTKKQVSYDSIISKFTNYDKEMILSESEFSNENITSYVQITNEIFQIKSCKRDNKISIFCLSEEHIYYPMFVPSRELENYDSFEGLMYFYFKSIDYYQENN